MIHVVNLTYKGMGKSIKSINQFMVNNLISLYLMASRSNTSLNLNQGPKLTKTIVKLSHLSSLPRKTYLNITSRWCCLRVSTLSNWLKLAFTFNVTISNQVSLL
jgi:hypothetical protein